MEKVFQIVVKGIASNKISVMNTSSFKEFEKLLIELQQSDCFIVLTTNTYIEDHGW